MLEIINHDNVREIRMVRPPVNALNTELVENLIQSLRLAAEESEAVVISGREGLFSAGLDVSDLMQFDYDGMTTFWTLYFELLETVACSPVPVAAAITGHSPAGGAVICLMCDYRVMSNGKYRIGLNETRVGLILPSVLHNAMERLVGPRISEKMLVSGSLVYPEEALRIGLVDQLETGFDATVEHAVHWCQELLSLPRESMQGNRAVARAHFKQEFAQYDSVGVKLFVDGWFSDATQNVINTLLAQLKNKN
jgi:3,2-trans-enoyl-CoA isomerase